MCVCVYLYSSWESILFIYIKHNTKQYKWKNAIRTWPSMKSRKKTKTFTKTNIIYSVFWLKVQSDFPGQIMKSHLISEYFVIHHWIYWSKTDIHVWYFGTVHKFDFDFPSRPISIKIYAFSPLSESALNWISIQLFTFVFLRR